ncbi:phosphotransferase family protein [Halolamina rubra]|uniref:phosphotransferase family protein n=1 Tax=Halolamina rubra TaxID=1380430 RepID=UPI00067881CF|nr:aminoglycoside phosphotransferase family protein [Halolamina rubra]
MGDPLAERTTRAFPDRSVASVDTRETRRGNATGLVRFEEHDPVYLKTTTDGPTRLVREIAATRYAGANAPIRVPGVVAADPDVPYLATEPLPGTPLNEPWTDDGDRERLLRRAGAALARTHEARFDRTGTVEGGDAASLELAGDDWVDTLRRTAAWRAEDWFPDRFADIPDRLIETVTELAPTIDERPALLHGDCSRINVHVDPTGLLDWERALVGDPAFDLVDAEGHLIDQIDVDEGDRDRLRAALYDGYTATAGSLPTGLAARRPLYRAFAHLLVPQTFESWAPTVETPNDELAADVREEFESRVAAAREAMT